jgi:phosphoenolpyruvate-protein kinase (PTS system EI component)
LYAPVKLPGVVGPAFVHAAGELEPARKTIPGDSVEEELKRFRSAIDAVVERLSETTEGLRGTGSEEEGAEIGPVEVGVMVETPAAAILAGELAPEVPFFSVGTNDLVQYTLAADHPAVLKLIKKTCEAAREAGIWLGVCGEAAADTALIPSLVELGVTELSMSAPSVPRAKKIVSEL